MREKLDSRHIKIPTWKPGPGVRRQGIVKEANSYLRIFNLGRWVSHASHSQRRCFQRTRSDRKYEDVIVRVLERL